MLHDACPPAQAVRVVETRPLRRVDVASSPGYGSELAATSLGWPSLPQWCVWVEPASALTDRWEQRWLKAVDAALDQWAGILPVKMVQVPEKAQIRLVRQRPPRRQLNGEWRASNGRSRLQVLEVRRQGCGGLSPAWWCWFLQSSVPRHCRPRPCMSSAMPLASGVTVRILLMRWRCIRGMSQCSAPAFAIASPSRGFALSPVGSAPIPRIADTKSCLYRNYIVYYSGVHRRLGRAKLPAVASVSGWFSATGFLGSPASDVCLWCGSGSQD